jgi:pimeloyl-ACP methyl ester carboxylesterase
LHGIAECPRREARPRRIRLAEQYRRRDADDRDAAFDAAADDRFRALMDLRLAEGRGRPPRLLVERLLADLRGKTDLDSFPEEDARRHRDRDREVPSSIESVPMADGRTLSMSVIKFPVRDATGRRFVGGMAPRRRSWPSSFGSPTSWPGPTPGWPNWRTGLKNCEAARLTPSSGLDDTPLPGIVEEAFRLHRRRRGDRPKGGPMSQPLIVVFLTAALISPSLRGAQPDGEAKPKPPGKLVDLGGRRLHVNVSGAGEPAVVIENGAGAFSVDWALVQPEVAKFTRVVTYDRAGYAWSDPGPFQDAIEPTVDDLHLLLREAGVRPPYVMVGASLGAIYVRSFQRRYPEEVAGLVFVDGTHDEGITFMLDGTRRPISQLSAGDLRRAYEQYEREAPRPKLGAADQSPLDRLPAELREVRHWAMGKLIEEVGLLPKGASAAESWRQEFTALRRQRLAESHPLGDLPLIAIERGKDGDEAWHAQQVQLAALSRRGQLLRAEGSGHMIHLYEPDVVTRAIREVILSMMRSPR